MKIRMVFPGLLTPQSLNYFSTIWSELTNALPLYQTFCIEQGRQQSLIDADGLPYSINFLLLDELDLIQTLLKAPPVKAELQQQLQNAGAGASSSGWLPEIMKLASSYAQIPPDDEELWEEDVSFFLAEETNVTSNYTPRTCSVDLVIRIGEWLKATAAEGLLTHLNSVFSDSSAS